MSSLTRRVLFCASIGLSLAVRADPPTLQQDSHAARLHSLAAREAQLQALSAMPGADVEYRAYGRLRKVEGHTGIFVAGVARLKRGDSAAALFQKTKQILLANGAESLVVRESGRSPIGAGQFVFTDQVIDGIPVIDARVNFIVDSHDEILMINSLFVPQGKARTAPQISMQAAKTELEQFLAEAQQADEGSVKIGTEGSLAFWTDFGKEATPRLLWILDAQYSQGGEPKLVRFGVDSTSGDIRYSEQRSFGLNRTVYTNAYRTTVATPTAGNLLWVEGSPNSGDPQAFSIYNRVINPIQTWSGTPFAYDVLGLVAHYGLPNSGDALQSFFIYGTDYKPYLIFGDSRASDDDVIAHEYGHGLFVGRVPNQPPSIRFYDEWFAGNEFWADLSAVTTDIRRFGVSNGSWAISDTRDWRDPKSKSTNFNDWYPSRYFTNPFLGVRYANSTIFGHAVYLMINGGRHRRVGQSALGGPIPDINVPAADPLQIKEVLSYGLWLVALYNDEFNGPNFKARTIAAANQIYGPGGVLNTVERAWTAVGIGFNCSGPPSTPNPTITNHYCMGQYDIDWTAMPGVKYHGMVIPLSGAWDVNGQTVLDGALSHCGLNLGTSSKFRMRACNACGCSAWTHDHYMQYYRPCL